MVEPGHKPKCPKQRERENGLDGGNTVGVGWDCVLGPCLGSEAGQQPLEEKERKS